MLFNLFRYSTGETILIFFGVLLIVSIPFVIGGAVVFALYRNKRNRAAWNQIASEIGFHMPNPKKLELKGNYNGIETRVAVGIRTHGSGEDRTREYFTYCQSRFPKPLRFALRINSPKNLLSGIIGKHSPPIGNANFDKRFHVLCYDHNVLRRLLLAEFPARKTANLMGELMLAHESYGIIKLTDTKVYIETSGHLYDHDELKRLLLVTNTLAGRFADAREKFPMMEWEQQLHLNWSRFATENSLRFDGDESVLEGVYGGYPINVRLHSEPGKWLTTIELRYHEPLMVGFNIYPELSIHKAVKLFGFQDIKAGHTEFDKAFVVKAKNVQVAKAKMTPGFCAQMVGLDQHTHNISLSDEGMKITLERVLGDITELTSYLKAMIAAMAKLR